MSETIVEWRGIQDWVIAEVLEDTLEKWECGPVTKLAGVSELSRTTESSTEAHYYDNLPAVVIASEGADEVTISTSALVPKARAIIAGYQYDEELGAIIEGERQSKYYAIGYKTKKSDKTEVYVWRYKGMFGIPDSTHTTENDGTDANGDEVVWTGVATTHRFGDYGSLKALVVDTSESQADLSTFFDKVTTPDALRGSSSASKVTYVDENGNEGVVTSDAGAVDYEYI